MKWEWTESDYAGDSLSRGTVGSAGGEKKLVKLEDVVEEVDRHARILGRKEELAG